MCTRTINIWQMLLNKWKKSLGGLTFLPPQSSIIKVRTSVWSQKMHKSVKITKNIWYVAICPVKQQFLTNTFVNMKKNHKMRETFRPGGVPNQFIVDILHIFINGTAQAIFWALSEINNLIRDPSRAESVPHFVTFFHIYRCICQKLLFYWTYCHILYMIC